MAKKVEIEIDINGKAVEGSIAQLKELKKQLKQTATGTKEFDQLYNQIDDLEDKIKSAKNTSSDWIDSLESAGGPLGMVGAGLNKLKVSTQSFGAALKATGIGLVVGLIGGLVAAFSQTEGSMKKLEPLLIAMEQIFGGILEALSPLIDGFVDLAMNVMPYVSKAFKVVYSAVTAVFQSLGKLGAAVVKLFKGDFKGAWEDAKASVTSFSDNYEAATERFDKGAKKMTKTQKENLDKQKEAAQKALDEKLKRMEAEDKLDEARMEKMKAEALAVAVTEQQKLDVEKAFADKIYQLKSKELDDKMALYKKDSNEYKALQAEKIKLESDYITTTTANKTKQKEITDKANKDLMDAEIQALNLKKAEGTIKEEEYQKAIYDIKKKYLTDKKDLIDAEIVYETYLSEQKKKKIAEERNIALSLIQDKINEYDRLNQIKQNDYDKDLERLAQKKIALDEAEKLELSNTELTEYEKTVIKQKYADKRKEITAEETKTEKEYKQSIIQGITQTLDSLAAVTSAVASLYDEEAKTSKDAFEKRKKLQIATAVMSAASGVIQILTQPSTLPSPFDWIVKGLNVVALGIATGINISKIKSTTFEGSVGASAAPAGNSAASLGKNYGDGGMIDGPRHAQGGTLVNAEGGEAIMTRGAVTMFAPLLSALNQAGGGTSFAPNALTTRYDAPNVSNPAQEKSPVIMKTYVVENELTTAQHKQARLKDLSTL
jgi:ABC-type Co2+ transport system permease subunit